MLKKLTLVAVAALGVAAPAQLRIIDRNFQRLDFLHVTSRIPAAHSTHKTMTFWQAGPNLTLPSTALAYGGSLYYTNEPEGMSGEHVGTFAMTSSYGHNAPDGGTQSNQESETLSWQLSKDSDSAFTLGTAESYTDATDFSVSGNGSITRALDAGQHWFFTPTLTYAHSKSTGLIADAWTPDFLVLFAPENSPAIFGVDFIVGTPAAATGVQVLVKYSFGKITDCSTSFKAAVQWTTGSVTTVSAVLAVTL